MFKSRISLISYTLFVIILSSLITTGIFHVFILKAFESKDEQQTITFISADRIARSPIKEDNNIIEMLSYGCHYCAKNESNNAELEKKLPAGSKLIRLHLSNPDNIGLASFAPVFATLSVMGIEEKYRESAYQAVMQDNINLADKSQLEQWLQGNNIDLDAYQQAHESEKYKALMQYMMAVSRYYAINATPTYIVGKKWMAQQDGSFSTFTQQLLSLLQNDQLPGK